MHALNISYILKIVIIFSGGDYCRNVVGSEGESVNAKSLFHYLLWIDQWYITLYCLLSCPVSPLVYLPLLPIVVANIDDSTLSLTAALLSCEKRNYEPAARPLRGTHHPLSSPAGCCGSPSCANQTLCPRDVDAL